MYIAIQSIRTKNGIVKPGHKLEEKDLDPKRAGLLIERKKLRKQTAEEIEEEKKTKEAKEKAAKEAAKKAEKENKDKK